MRRVTFLFDVNNTLIDNDRAKKDISARIDGLLGVAGERRFWELYEEVRHDRGLVISRSFWRAMAMSSMRILRSTTRTDGGCASVLPIS